jgi:hypothetical protein
VGSRRFRRRHVGRDEEEFVSLFKSTFDAREVEDET